MGPTFQAMLLHHPYDKRIKKRWVRIGIIRLARGAFFFIGSENSGKNKKISLPVEVVVNTCTICKK